MSSDQESETKSGTLRYIRGRSQRSEWISEQRENHFFCLQPWLVKRRPVLQEAPLIWDWDTRLPLCIQQEHTHTGTHNYTQSCIHSVQIFIYIFYVSVGLWKDGFGKVFTLRTTESVKKYADFSNRLIDSTCCSIWLVPFGYLSIKESGRKVSLCPGCGFYEPCQAWQNKKEEHKTESMHWGKSVMLKILFRHYFTFAALVNCKWACCNSFYNAGELNFSLLCHKKVLLYDLNVS